jgi:hypothetical protein
MLVKAMIFATCIGLAACAQMRAKRVNERLDSFIGKPVSELALIAGPPTNQFDTGSGQRAFQWEHSGETQSPGMATNIGGTLLYSAPQAHRTECRLSVVASTSNPNPTLGDWIILRWNYAGNGCI